MNNRFELFTALISRIQKNVKRIKNIGMSEYNLKGIHVSIIYYLHKYQTLTSKELAEKCEEDKGAISRALNYLESCEYLTCDSKNVKRYNSPILLNEKGNQIALEILDRVNKVLDEISSCMTNEERISFYQILTKLSDKLEYIIID